MKRLSHYKEGLLKSLLSVALCASLFTLSNPSHAQLGIPNLWGSNQYGQLGDGTNNNTSNPLALTGVGKVIQISTGLSHTLALKIDGTVWAWGRNQQGQLGTGNNTDSNTPVQITTLSKIVQVAAGDGHSLALAQDGSVWAWGQNDYGQLGIGNTIGKNVPTKVSNLAKVVQITAGQIHSIALKVDGTVWGWGGNRIYQLGVGDPSNHTAPTRISTFTNIIQVTAGQAHTLALTTDGSVWAWGANNQGQIGDGSNDAFKTSPRLIKGISDVLHLAAGKFHSLAQKLDGTVWAWGSTGSKTPLQVAGLEKILQVAGGGTHSLALNADGDVWAWGGNDAGQLGDGTTTDHSNPTIVPNLANQTLIAAGDAHSASLIAIKQNSKLTPFNIKLQYGKPVGLLGVLKNKATGMPILQTPVGFTLNGVDKGSAYTKINGLATQVVADRLTYTVGTYPIVISFAGNGLYNPATSVNATLTILKADTLLVAAKSTGAYGQIKTLIATLKRKTDKALLANMTVSYTLDSKKIGDVTTDGTGKAGLNFKVDDTLTVGTHTLKMDFAGDGNHNASTLTTTLTVTKANTTVLANKATVAYGKSTGLLAILKRATDKQKLSSQKLTFKIDGTQVGTATTNASGQALLNYKATDALTPGAHNLEVSFAGNDKLNETTGKATLTVTPANTALLLLNSSGSYGQSVKLTATLKRTTDKAKLAKQTVSFLVDGTKVGDATTDDKGNAIFAYALDDTLTPGTHTLEADFAATDHYNASTATGTLTAKVTATKLTVVAASGKVGETVNLTAKLKRSTDGKGLAGKPLHFLVDGVEVGVGETNSDGIAILSFTIPDTLKAGAHTLVATFAGDDYYKSSTSNSASLTVK